MKLNILLTSVLATFILLAIGPILGANLELKDANAMVPPNMPEEFAIAAGDGEISLVWTLPNAGGISDPDVTGYNIYRGPASDPGSEILLTTITESRPAAYTDNGLTNGDSLCYRMTALAGSVEGSSTPKKCAAPAPDGPNVVKLFAGDYSSASIPYERDPIIPVGRTGDFLEFEFSISDTSSYKLMIYGEDDTPGPVQVDVELDGATVDTISYSANNNEYHEEKVGFNQLSTGTHHVKLTFLNDISTDQSNDRNFYLRWIRLIAAENENALVAQNGVIGIGGTVKLIQKLDTISGADGTLLSLIVQEPDGDSCAANNLAAPIPTSGKLTMEYPTDFSIISVAGNGLCNTNNAGIYNAESSVDVNGIIKKLRAEFETNFFVIPESAVGTLALVVSSIATLGGLMFWKRKQSNGQPHFGDLGI